MSGARRYRRELQRARRHGAVVRIAPNLDDNLPPQVKNALAVRAMAARTGTCPICGAEAEMSSPIQPGAIVYVTWRHDDDCPAVDPLLDRSHA